MAAGKASVQCWPTDEAQDVLKTLSSRGCCSIGQRLMLGSTQLEAFQSLAEECKTGAAPDSSGCQIIRHLRDSESNVCTCSCL